MSRSQTPRLQRQKLRQITWWRAKARAWAVPTAAPRAPIARRARASGNDLPAAADSLADRQDLHRRLFTQGAADR
jgi:hypothetical protein